MGYHEYRYWSPLHDAEMVRLSVFDQRGAEYWMLLPVVSPRKYRHRRMAALETIDYAIQHELEPGQVRVAKEHWEISIGEVMTQEREKQLADQSAASVFSGQRQDQVDD